MAEFDGITIIKNVPIGDRRSSLMDTVTIRFALGNKYLSDPNKIISLNDVDNLKHLGSAMLDRDANVHQDMFERLGYIKSWAVELNPKKGNRLELVIVISLLSGI